MPWAASCVAIGFDTAASDMTGLPGPGSAHTKGSYVQMEASLSVDIWGFYLHVGYQTSTTGTADYLFDLATGAAASEVVQVANVLWTGNNRRISQGQALIPLEIASGTRIATRTQTNSTSTVELLGIGLTGLEKDEVSGATACVTYGENTGTTRGTEIDPGAVANTKGAYVQVTGSTSADFNFVMVSWGQLDNAVITTLYMLFDLATGAAASEVVLWANQPAISGETAVGQYCGFPRSTWTPDVASGTRLAMRAQCTITDATDRLVNAVLHCLDVPEAA